MPVPHPQLILASGSSIRRQLLENAGVAFAVDPADLDEKAILATLRDRATPVPQRALHLAGIKSETVSRRHGGALVIGADQILEADGHIVSKSTNPEAARTVLMRLRGKRHYLHSGVAIARDGSTLWSHVGTASLTMREFSQTWLDAYMAASPEALTTSVGAYQFEGLGVQLFSRIEGDYFTILGLPLLELLAQLRRLQVLET